MVGVRQDKKTATGYKKTDVGVIPSDWEVTRIDEVINVIDGDRGINYPNAGDFSSDGYCLFLSAQNVTKDGFRFAECAFITADKDLALSKGKLKKGDIVLTTRGTVGNFAFFDDSVPFDNLRINSGMVILRNESTEINNLYLYNLLKSRVLGAQIDRLVFGSAQPQLTVKGISQFLIVLPPRAEQSAIAFALSDAAALIDVLEKLVAKKRAIKHGAMQELLTGKRRLPGFSGEWAVVGFNEALKKIGTKLNQIQTQDYAGHGSHPVIDQGQSRIAAYSDDDSKLFKCPDGGVIVFGDHTRIIKFIDFNFVVGADGTQVLGVQNGYLARFMYYQLLQKEIPSTGYNRHFKFLKEMKFFRPSCEEQAVIAGVLSDMDSEIDALQDRLAKYKAIKQGMMQVLLTGRIRLPN